MEQDKIIENKKLCDGCNVRGNWEHRCFGFDCDCDNIICMERQGKITYEEMMAIVNNATPRDPANGQHT